VGSDAGSCGVPHGVGLLRELELMERAGMSPQAVIAAATGWGAAHLRIRERVGRVAPGAFPRMIFTRHSPLETVKNLAKGRLVVFDGEVFASGGRVAEEGL
jgi:imidazolonepropionase-like amidohydrolase